MQIPILSGIYADASADWRTRYPRNMEPVPKSIGVSEGFLRPADGIQQVGTGPGVDRGAFKWNGIHYRVMGTKLVQVSPDGVVQTLGEVGSGGQVTMDNGFDQLAIWSAGQLFYWNGSALTQVIDPDLGTVIDGCWIAGYFMSTDGKFVIVTELNDPTSVNPLKYGSSEADPDPIVAVRELRNEAVIFNRYTIEVLQNVGGDNFPFQRVDGAEVPFGAIGTHAIAEFGQTFAFVGSGKNEGKDEPVSVYLMASGTAQKLATAEVERMLMNYTEDQLADVVLETRSQKGHIQLLIHLPDQCLVYDLAASQVLGTPAWHTLDSGSGVTPETYRGRNFIWDDRRWFCADPTSAAIGYLVQDSMKHYGANVGWEFGTMVLYNEGRPLTVSSLELVATPGRVELGEEPTIWWSYSLDGETWSMERPLAAGKQGQRNKRLQWRKCGSATHYRMERFRGSSDARIPIARLEAEIRP
jgi:hypothetical protein